jgi:hypothetical protein
MALRKYQATTNKDSQVVTTGDGHTLVRGRFTAGGGGGGVIAPPENGFWVASGEYWMGPFGLYSTNVNGNPSTFSYLIIQNNDIQYHPMFEGVE